MKGSREQLHQRRAMLKRLLAEMEGGDVGDTSYAHALLEVAKADLDETEEALRHPQP